MDDTATSPLGWSPFVENDTDRPLVFTFSYRDGRIHTIKVSEERP